MVLLTVSYTISSLSLFLRLIHTSRIEPGWATGFIEAVMQNNHLPINMTYAGTTSGVKLANKIQERYEAKIDSMFYWWFPDPMFAILKSKSIAYNKITFPTYNAKCAESGDATPNGGEDCDFGIQSLENIINKNFQKKAPEAYNVISQMNLKTSHISRLMLLHGVATKERDVRCATKLCEVSNAFKSEANQKVIIGTVEYANCISAVNTLYESKSKYETGSLVNTLCADTVVRELGMKCCREMNGNGATYCNIQTSNDNVLLGVAGDECNPDRSDPWHQRLVGYSIVEDAVNKFIDENSIWKR